jgi:plastocyanin
MVRRWRILAVVPVTAFAMGCGKQTLTSSVKAPPPPAAGTHATGTVVGIRSGVFLPQDLVVIAGHPVTWENADQTEVLVSASDGAHFRSPRLRTGQTFTWTPRRAGMIRYDDALHPRVTGTIRVIS